MQSVAVVGSMADKPNIGDKGSSAVRPPATVTALAGIKASFGPARIMYHDGADLSAAVPAARDADVAIVIVGYTARDEGEATAMLDATAISMMAPRR